MTKISYQLAILTTVLIFHNAISKSTVKHLRNKNTQEHTIVIPEEFEEQLDKLIKDKPIGIDNSPSRNHDEGQDDIQAAHLNLDEYTIEAQADLITSLPGLSFTPTFRQFSGYIPVSPTRNIHYWYIESSNNPANDPVVFWTNGKQHIRGGERSQSKNKFLFESLVSKFIEKSCHPHLT